MTSYKRNEKNHDAADAVDIDELEEMVDSEKQDDLGRTGASMSSSTNGKLQLEVKRYRCPTPTLGQQEIKTQASLLSGQYYKGHDYQLAQGTIVFSTSVHSTIRLRLPGFFKKDNENGMLVQVGMAPGARLRTVCAKRRPRIPFSIPCCCEGSKGVYQTVYPKRRGILYRPFSKRIGLSTG